MSYTKIEAPQKIVVNIRFFYLCIHNFQRKQRRLPLRQPLSILGWNPFRAYYLVINSKALGQWKTYIRPMMLISQWFKFIIKIVHCVLRAIKCWRHMVLDQANQPTRLAISLVMLSQQYSTNYSHPWQRIHVNTKSSPMTSNAYKSAFSLVYAF